MSQTKNKSKLSNSESQVFVPYRSFSHRTMFSRRKLQEVSRQTLLHLLCLDRATSCSGLTRREETFQSDSETRSRREDEGGKDQVSLDFTPDQLLGSEEGRKVALLLFQHPTSLLHPARFVVFRQTGIPKR